MIAEELKKYKARSLVIAKQLQYGKEVLERIKEAKTEHDVTRALRYGRLKED